MYRPVLRSTMKEKLSDAPVCIANWFRGPVRIDRSQFSNGFTASPAAHLGPGVSGARNIRRLTSLTVFLC